MKFEAVVRTAGVWLREVGGWLLIGLGLLAFFETWRMLRGRWIFESVPMAFVAFIIFRGGIHLLKVAVAARAAQQAASDIDAALRRPRLPLPKPAAPRK